MPTLNNSLHNINSFFFTPLQSLQQKKPFKNSDKLGFLTYGALLDSNVRVALNKILLTPKVNDEIPAQVLVDIEKYDWSPIRAWREYFHITMETIAKSIEMEPYSYMKTEENPDTLCKIQKITIARELGITLTTLNNSIEKYQKIQRSKETNSLPTQ